MQVEKMTEFEITFFGVAKTKKYVKNLNAETDLYGIEKTESFANNRKAKTELCGVVKLKVLQTIETLKLNCAE